jgi:hypothetical protein
MATVNTDLARSISYEPSLLSDDDWFNEKKESEEIDAEIEAAFSKISSYLPEITTSLNSNNTILQSNVFTYDYDYKNDDNDNYNDNDLFDDEPDLPNDEDINEISSLSASISTSSFVPIIREKTLEPPIIDTSDKTIYKPNPVSTSRWFFNNIEKYHCPTEFCDLIKIAIQDYISKSNLDLSQNEINDIIKEIDKIQTYNYTTANKDLTHGKWSESQITSVYYILTNLYSIMTRENESSQSNLVDQPTESNKISKISKINDYNILQLETANSTHSNIFCLNILNLINLNKTLSAYKSHNAVTNDKTDKIIINCIIPLLTVNIGLNIFHILKKNNSDYDKIKNQFRPVVYMKIINGIIQGFTIVREKLVTIVKEVSSATVLTKKTGINTFYNKQQCVYNILKSFAKMYEIIRAQTELTVCPAFITGSNSLDLMPKLDDLIKPFRRQVSEILPSYDIHYGKIIWDCHLTNCKKLFTNQIQKWISIVIEHLMHIFISKYTNDHDFTNIIASPTNNALITTGVYDLPIIFNNHDLNSKMNTDIFKIYKHAEMRNLGRLNYEYHIKLIPNGKTKISREWNIPLPEFNSDANRQAADFYTVNDFNLDNIIDFSTDINDEKKIYYEFTINVYWLQHSDNNNDNNKKKSYHIANITNLVKESVPLIYCDVIRIPDFIELYEKSIPFAHLLHYTVISFVHTTQNNQALHPFWNWFYIEQTVQNTKFAEPVLLEEYTFAKNILINKMEEQNDKIVLDIIKSSRLDYFINKFDT